MLLVTEWEEFVNLDWAAMKQIMARPLVIDGRNALDGQALLELGFEYEGVVPVSAEYTQLVPRRGAA